MAKHVKSADLILSGPMSKFFKYLGRFKNRTILERGHNQTPKGETIEQCFARCAKMSTIRKRTCETNCAINQ
jgi:hypothetical protein